MNETPEPQDTLLQKCVRLEESRDGVWAHFRVGKGYAFSLNLSLHPFGKQFAIEFHRYRATLEKNENYTMELPESLKEKK